MSISNSLSVSILFTAALLVAFSSQAQAQNIGYSVSNEFRYGTGEQFKNDEAETKEYLENLFSTRFYVGDFRFGFRAQLDKPREFGPDTVGLTQYFGEFTRDELRIRGGTFYNLVGQGLVYNSFESRPIGFNTQAEGIKANYDRKEFSVGAYGGALSYSDILEPERVEDYVVRGASGELRLIDEVTLGGSILTASAESKRGVFSDDFDTYLREAYISGDLAGFSALVNYARKGTSTDSGVKAEIGSDGNGFAWYGKLGYSGDLFSLAGEYKNYRFDLVHPLSRDVTSRVTKALPFQNGPTLVPEHDKTLLARDPHAIDFNDEVGFQISGLVYPSEALTLNFIATAASRHTAWDQVIMDTGTGEFTEYRLVNGERVDFPKISDDQYSPYWELFLQADYDVSDDLALAMAVQRKDNRIKDEISSIVEVEQVTTVMLESIISLAKRDNLHAILEVQRAFKSKDANEAIDSLGIEAFDGRFLNALLTLEFTHSPSWSVNGRLEWSTSKKEQGGRRVWPVVGGTYRIGRTHTLSAQYGWERGGVVCTGGVCRFINPFTGFRLGLTSKL